MLLLANQPLKAADLGEPASVPAITPVSPWTFELGGYAFIPLSVEGSSTVDGGTVNLDLGPEEVFDLFEFAISGRFEAWRARDAGDGSGFGLIMDGQYVNLGLKNSSIGPASSGTVDADIRQGIVDVLAGYRFPSIAVGATTGQRVEIDASAGIRYNFLRQKINVTPGLPAPFTANLGGDRHWVSPVVGARANWIINDTWNALLRGDMSGFGVAGERFSWSLTGLAGYKVTEKATLRLGYRVYDMDYSDGSGANEFAFDATQHGPFAGFSYKF
jgi:opacity protein-like surface antigen